MSSSASKPLVGLDALSQVFDLGVIHSCLYLPFGFLNRNWRIASDRGVFAVKELGHTAPDRARRTLELQERLAALGVPVVAAVPSAAGGTVPEINEHSYYLTPWIEGTHPRGAEMDAGMAFHMGSVIGRTHNALADPSLGLDAPKEPPLASDTALGAAREAIVHHLGRIGAKDEPREFDIRVREVLQARLELLAAHAHLRPSGDEPTGPYGWMHGDCQNWNLLWSGRTIAAVLDWDRACVKPYGEEIVRAAMYQFVHPDGSVDLHHVAAMVAGYRTEAAIDAAALADAARRRWWRMATSTWQLEFHYGRGDRSSDLFFANERLVQWWTANLDKVEAVFAAA